jgi:hypothetical protein
MSKNFKKIVFLGIATAILLFIVFHLLNNQGEVTKEYPPSKTYPVGEYPPYPTGPHERYPTITDGPF